MDLRAFLRCQSLTPYVASSETSLLIDRFKILRAETRAEIRSETKAELGYERDGALCAITFILALLLALLDTTLLELLSGIQKVRKITPRCGTFFKERSKNVWTWHSITILGHLKVSHSQKRGWPLPVEYYMIIWQNRVTLNVLVIGIGLTKT